MTPDAFEKLVVGDDPAQLADAVALLTAAERRRLSKTASRILRTIERHAEDRFTKRSPSSLDGHLKDWLEGCTWEELDRKRDIARLAVLAVCPISQTRRVSGRLTGSDAELVRILSDRRPEWIDEWVEAKLNGDWFDIEWETVRELVRQGVATKPASEGYARLMVLGLPDPWGPGVRRHTPLSEKLIAEPDVLEDELWRLFEVETLAFSLDYAEQNPKAPGNYESWRAAILKLAAEGVIDRQRVLDATLAGLAAGFKSNTLSGYIRLHDELKPSLEEICARQSHYLDLLMSQASHVVTFALKKLKPLERARRLDGPAFVDSVGRVFDIRTKTQPKLALETLARSVVRDPTLRAAAARLAADALVHEAPDVQELALELLEEWETDIDATVARLVEERMDHLSAMHRDRAARLARRLGGSSATPPDRSQLAEAAHDNDLYEADLLERAASIEPEARVWAGVDAAVRVLEDGDAIEPLDLDLLETSVLLDAPPVEPIATVDELIDAVAHAVEVVDSATEVERLLDGISRLCDETPESFERRTAPVLKRIRDGGGSESSGLLRSWGVPLGLGCVVMAWLRGVDPRLPPERNNPENGPRKAITCRLMELARRVVRRVSAPLLAAPTHAPGWIEPARFVERLAEIRENGLEVPRLDLIHALLRLAPDGRKAARRRASSIEGDVGRIVRWALGGDEQPSRRDREHAAVWVAAARCRDPRGELEQLAPLGIHREVPDAWTAAKHSWQTWAECRTYPDGRGGQVTHTVPQLRIERRPDRFKRVETAEFPSVAMHVRAHRYSVHGVHGAWLVEWISTLWPLNLEAFFAAGATTLAGRIDMTSSTFEPCFAYLVPLLEPGRPLSGTALLSECLGLISKDADARRTAIDVLIEAIRDGRAHPTALCRGLVRLHSGGWIKLNRLADTLREVASASTLARWVVASTLDAFIASLKTPPRDTHHILSLLVETLTELDLGASAAAGRVLRKLSGSSKTGRLARTLLGLEDRSKAEARRAVLEALDGRIERASRYVISARKETIEAI